MQIQVGDKGQWNTVTDFRVYRSNNWSLERQTTSPFLSISADVDFWRSDRMHLVLTLDDFTQILTKAVEMGATPAFPEALIQRLAEEILDQQPEEEHAMTPDIQAHIKSLETDAARLRAAAGEAAAKIARLEERLRSLKVMMEAAMQMEQFHAKTESGRSAAPNGRDGTEA